MGKKVSKLPSEPQLQQPPTLTREQILSVYVNKNQRKLRLLNDLTVELIESSQQIVNLAVEMINSKNELIKTLENKIDELEKPVPKEKKK